MKIMFFGIFLSKEKSRQGELNPRPADYESAAIPLSHGGTIPYSIDVPAI